MKSFSKLLWVELKLYFREPVAAFFTLLFPLMFLLIFGSIYGNQPVDLFGGHGTIDLSVPSYTGMIASATGIISLSVGFASYRERGLLRRLKTTPVNPLAVLAAQGLVLVLMTILGMGLLVLTGKLIYDLRFHGSFLAMAGALLVSCLSLFSLGFVVASLSSTARTAQTVSMVLFYPMMIISGSSVPRELFPENLQRASKLFPLTHAVTVLRGAWFGLPFCEYLTEVWILFAFSAAALAVSVRFFRLD